MDLGAKRKKRGGKFDLHKALEEAAAQGADLVETSLDARELVKHNAAEKLGTIALDSRVAAHVPEAHRKAWLGAYSDGARARVDKLEMDRWPQYEKAFRAIMQASQSATAGTTYERTRSDWLASCSPAFELLGAEGVAEWGPTLQRYMDRDGERMAAAERRGTVEEGRKYAAHRLLIQQTIDAFAKARASLWKLRTAAERKEYKGEGADPAVQAGAVALVTHSKSGLSEGSHETLARMMVDGALTATIENLEGQAKRAALDGDIKKAATLRTRKLVYETEHDKRAKKKREQKEEGHQKPIRDLRKRVSKLGRDHKDRGAWISMCDRALQGDATARAACDKLIQEGV